MPDAPLTAATYDTPFGDLAVLTTPEDDVVRAAGFHPLARVAAQTSRAHLARGWASGEQAHVAVAMDRWLAGDADALAEVPVEQEGGPFFQEVWAALRTVPAGAVVSYQELAESAGRPRAMRAAGTACAHNSAALFVPCHRVIRSGGRLGSYGLGGLGVKVALLEREGFVVDAVDESAGVLVGAR